MLLTLDNKLLEDESCFQYLDRVIHLLADQRHSLYIELGQEDIIMESLWYKSLSERQGDTIFLLIEKTINNSEFLRSLIKTGIKRVEITQNGVVDFLNYLEEPVYIVLEDIESDRYFLESLFFNFKSKSKKLVKYLEKKWLRYIHAGGKGRIPKVIENQIRGFNVRPELFVLIDSDKEDVGQEYSTDILKVVDFCGGHEIPLHVLHKREIENYLPDETLQLNIPSELQSVLTAYLKLTPEQKDFYDLEKGFNGKRVGQLYEQIEEEDLKIIKDGFYKNKVLDPKSEFYKYFSTESCKQSLLIKRCIHQSNPLELQDIIISINKLL